MDNFLKDQLNRFSAAPAISAKPGESAKRNNPAQNLPRPPVQNVARAPLPSTRWPTNQAYEVSTMNQGMASAGYTKPYGQASFGVYDSVPGVEFRGVTNTGFHGIPPMPPLSTIPVQDVNASYYGNAHGFALPVTPSYYTPSNTMSVNTVRKGSLSGMERDVSPQPLSAAALDPHEERKRLEAQRQQHKIKQSFHASRSKTVDANTLLDKIAADFQTGTSSNVRARPESNSRPATPSSPSLMSPQTAVTPKENSPEFKVEEPIRSIDNRMNPSRPVLPDLNDMMMKFSDLSTTTGSNKNFQPIRPATTTITPRTASFSTSQTARDWKNLPDDLSSAFNSVIPGNAVNSPVSPHDDLPPWCNADASTLPPVYHMVLSHFRKGALVHKEKVFAVLSQSGLSRTTLSKIWETTSRTRPDELTRDELCAALALTGLAQSNFDVQHLTIDVLRRIPSPPVPQFIASPPQQTPISVPPVSLAPISAQHFEDIPLSFPATTPAHIEEDEFSDFVSATVPIESVVSPADVPMKPVSFGGIDLKPMEKFGSAVPMIPGEIIIAPKVVQMKPLIFEGKSDKNAGKISPPVSSVLGMAPEVVPEKTNNKFDVKPVKLDSQLFAGSVVASKPVPVKPLFGDQRNENNIIKAQDVSSSGQQEEMWADWTQVPVAKPSPIISPISSAVEPLATKTDVQNKADDPYAAFRGLIIESDVSVFTSVDPSQNWASQLEKSEESSDSKLNAGLDSPSGDNQSVNSLDISGLSLQLTFDEDDRRSSPLGILPKSSTGESLSEMAMEDHVEVWKRALRVCADVIQEGCTILNSVSNSKVLVAVMEKASSSISNIVEIYRVARRVYLAAKLCNLMDNKEIIDGIKETEEAWADFAAFLSIGSLEPQRGSMDYSACEFGEQLPPLNVICGLCLLNVDGRSKTRKNPLDGMKIESNGRFYHSPCANFWANCVNANLPRLTYP